MKNYYQLLGVDRKASRQQINAAFKKLSLKYHPDKNGGDLYYLELFKEINEAKQVLCDLEKRGEYDSSLEQQSRLPIFFRDKHNRRRRKIHSEINEGSDLSKLKTVKWFATIVGLAIAIMFILIAIDNAINLFSENEQPVFLRIIIKENRNAILAVIQSQFVQSLFNS